MRFNPAVQRFSRDVPWPYPCFQGIGYTLREAVRLILRAFIVANKLEKREDECIWFEWKSVNVIMCTRIMVMYGR